MIHIQELTINNQFDPIGQDWKVPPVFGWKYPLIDGLRQTHYRIIVAKDKKFETVVWDSGRRLSALNCGIQCEGVLESDTVYYCRILAETNLGLAESDISTFETGLPETEWDRQWLYCPLNFGGNALYVRKNFYIPEGEITRARAYVIGLGYHEFYVNGKKISNHVLAPAPTDFDKRLFYCTYDITENIDSGKQNCFAFHIGKGWAGEPRMNTVIKCFYKDGNVHTIRSSGGERWWMKGSPVRQNSIYGGEIYDAREETERWASIDLLQNDKTYYDLGWSFALYKKIAKNIIICPQNIPANVIKERISPVHEKCVSKNKTLYCFEKYITGWLSIKVKGARGASVVIRYSEILGEDGLPDRRNLRSANNTDIYILKGDPEEKYSPHFTFRGFIYAEVESFDGAEIVDISAEYVKTDILESGEFESSDRILNKLHAIAVRTEGCNQMGIFSDCPQRDERFGWLNDWTTRFFQTVNNFDMSQCIEKILADITDTMDESGAICDTAPYYIGQRPADPVVVCYLLLAKFAYERYGNIRALQTYYPFFRKWTDFLLNKTEQNILNYSWYGDWCPPYRDKESDGRKYTELPKGYISTCFLYWHCTILCEFAFILNKREDGIYYKRKAAAIKKSFNAKYFSENEGFYGTNTQTENALALSLGLVKRADYERVYYWLREDVIKKGNHFSGGNQAYLHILRVLAEHGDHELIYKVLTNPEYPGWGYMLQQGAVSVWERWESDLAHRDMQSYCHSMFGSYDVWFYQYLCGITIKSNCRGMGEIDFRPAVPETLTYAHAELDCPNGRILSEWKRTEKNIVFRFVLPSNMVANFYVPENIKEFGSYPRVYKLNAGTHTFTF